MGRRTTAASTTLDIVATNYAYGGIADGDQIPAGVTVIRLDNQADEYHEIILFRRNEGTTETLDELMACPTRRLDAKVTDAGGGFAAPGTVGGTVVDLAPGDYIGLCFIPKGTTQEAMDQMAAAGSAPDGQRPDRHRRARPTSPSACTSSSRSSRVAQPRPAPSAMTMTSMDMTPATTG